MNGSNERSGILAGGNFIVDRVKLIGHWPEQDTLASIESETTSNGGGPYNILKDLAKLAPMIPRSAVGLIGNDKDGDWIVDDCLANGIDINQLHRTSESSTSYTDAMSVSGTGRRTFFHRRGTNALLAPEHFDFTGSHAKIFVLGYLMLLDRLDQFFRDGMTGAAEVLRRAQEAGLSTAVDCVSLPGEDFRRVVLSAAQYAEILFINEFEIGQVLEKSVGSNRDELMQAAKELLDILPAEVSTEVVLHCPRGAVVAKNNGDTFAQASLKIPQPKIRGASGAGDAFAAGYLLGRHQDCPVSTCLGYAVSSAAQSLTDPTPSDGMKTLEECLLLVDQFGFNEF